jgi:hypothetical protein
LDAAQIAQELGIRVYTIGVGTNGKALSPVAIYPNGQYKYDYVKVEIDEDMLKKTAEMTGGRYFRATDEKKLREASTRRSTAGKNPRESDRAQLPHGRIPLAFDRWLLAAFLWASSSETPCCALRHELARHIPQCTDHQCGAGRGSARVGHRHRFPALCPDRPAAVPFREAQHALGLVRRAGAGAGILDRLRLKNRAMNRFGEAGMLPGMVPGVSSWRTTTRFLLLRHGLGLAIIALGRAADGHPSGRSEGQGRGRGGGAWT